MSRPHPLLVVMLVVVRVTATHHTVPHVRVRQLPWKAQSWAPLSYTLNYAYNKRACVFHTALLARNNALCNTMYICMFIHTKGNAMCASISEGSVSHTNVFGLCKKKRAVTRRVVQMMMIRSQV